MNKTMWFPRLPIILNKKEILNNDVILIYEIQSPHCKNPHPYCGGSCNPICNFYSLTKYYPYGNQIPDTNEYNLKLSTYSTTLNRIRTGGATIELIRELVILCHGLYDLVEQENDRVRLVWDAVSLQQNGHCIFPDCKRNSGKKDGWHCLGLHGHHCLAVSKGGKTSEDNCVLVCPHHHNRLEQFSSKVEVMEYLKGIKV